MMISIYSLRDIHTGRPAVVLGGGPSLQADLAWFPRRAVLFGVNQHWIQFIWGAQFLVFMDEPGRNKIMLELVQTYMGVKVSPLFNWTDVDLAGADWWKGNFSSHLAVWLACYMGCDPVLLYGIDCYQGPRSLDADLNDNAYNTSLEEHLAGWRQAFEKCPHPERIRAMSGPLVEIFGTFP